MVLQNPVKIKITLIFTCLTACCHANIYEVAKFADINSIGFNHLTVIHSGDVYIGGVNNIYKLTSDLKLEHNVSTGPVEDPDEGWIDNYNKILSINRDDNNIVTCGSYRGYCQLRNLEDLSIDVDDNGVYVASPRAEDSTVGFVAPGYGDERMMYVGVTRTQETHGDPAVSLRQITDSNPFIIPTVGTKPVLITIQSIYRTFITHYVSGFSYHGYSYFLITQRQDPDDVNSSHYISRISRVCQEENVNTFESYTEVTLECHGNDGSLYNLIQAAHVIRPATDITRELGLSDREEVLFAVFAKQETVTNNKPVPSHQSAVCMYRMTDIEQEFSDAILGCIRGNPSYTLEIMTGATCNQRPTTITDPTPYECYTHEQYRYANGVDPVVNEAVFEYSDILTSSITMTTVEQHTIGIIGTSTGQMQKVHFLSASTANVYENITLLDDSSAVLPDMMFSQPVQDHVYVLTEQQVHKLKVQKCSQYITCESCFSSRDPYCGWCTLERRCSLFSECQNAISQSRWLDVFSNSECVDITIVPTASMPVNTREKINITVTELPYETSENTYQCVYDGQYYYNAMKTENQLTCDTPPVNQRPPIPAKQDHVTVQLAIRSTETNINFVDTNFHFYKCSTHKICTDCVTRAWACDWCTYGNQCTHNSNSCSLYDYELIVAGENNIFSSSDRKGQEFCPQLMEQDDKIFIPVGTPREFLLNANVSNLPKQDANYKCILNVEGEKQDTPATLNDDNTITCVPRSYTYKTSTQELVVDVTVEWKADFEIDDIYGNQVTLYDCSVDRSDCSECLSNITTKEILNCGWCSKSDSCQIEEFCTGGSWLPQDSADDVCGAPIITEIWPLSGPIEGNTELVVNGSNLGKAVSAIKSVTVAGLPCEVIPSRYKVAKGLECTTAPCGDNSCGSGKVMVQLSNGNGESEDDFYYRNPNVVDFNPKIGPEAGGTRLVITGEYMDAGRHITVDIDGSPCEVDRDEVNETVLICMTSDHPIQSDLKLLVSFDGAVRFAPDDKLFEYTENPNVTSVYPLESIKSGGRKLNVTGIHFISVREPLMTITSDTGIFISDPCVVLSSKLMQCVTPNVTSPTSRRKRQTCTGDQCTYQIGFRMDGHEFILEYQFKVYEDPVYYQFEDDGYIMENLGVQLPIKGKNLNSACTRKEVTVTVGDENCNVTSLSPNQLSCIPPQNEPSGVNKDGYPTENNLPEVTVAVGNLQFFIGYLRYQRDSIEFIPAIISGSVVGFCVLITVIVVLLIVFKRRMNKLDRRMEDYTRQTMMKVLDVNVDVRNKNSTDVPFLNFNDYVANMLFDRDKSHQPIFQMRDKITSHDVGKALDDFYSLLVSKDFCCMVVHTFQESRLMSVKDREYICALLVVALHKERKMMYLTEVLKELLADPSFRSDYANVQEFMSQRTESITETLLYNWFVLALYPFIKTSGGEPIYLLFKSIDDKVNKEAVSGVGYTGAVNLSEGTVNERAQDVFKTLLTMDKVKTGKPLLPVKYMFDYLDSVVNSHHSDTGLMENTLKNSSLLLRIWANILKSPQSVLDINVSPAVMTSLQMMAETFMNSCSSKQGQTKEYAVTGFTKDIAVYKGMVDKYCEDIQELPGVGDRELAFYLDQTFTELEVLNGTTVLYELYKFFERNTDMIANALEKDEKCQQQCLSLKWREVVSTMVENEGRDRHENVPTSQALTSPYVVQCNEPSKQHYQALSPELLDSAHQYEQLQSHPEPSHEEQTNSKKSQYEELYPKPKPSQYEVPTKPKQSDYEELYPKPIPSDYEKLTTSK
ncbi:plexin-B-like [Glandiceps talaboti]